MAHTIRERLAAGLESRGWTCLEKGRRFWQFSGPVAGMYLFLGAAGALRKGRNISSSRSIGDSSAQSPVYRALLQEGDAKLGNIPRESAEALIADLMA